MCIYVRETSTHYRYSAGVRLKGLTNSGHYWSLFNDVTAVGASMFLEINTQRNARCQVLVITVVPRAPLHKTCIKVAAKLSSDDIDSPMDWTQVLTRSLLN